MLSRFKAKRKYDAEERKSAAAKERGHTTWMLPDLSDKIDREAKVRKLQDLNNMRLHVGLLLSS